MKYKHIHRQNPYQLPTDRTDRDKEERILNWGSLIVGIVLIALLLSGFIV
jgi:hypothetical protein